VYNEGAPEARPSAKPPSHARRATPRFSYAIPTSFFTRAYQLLNMPVLTL
jgi:hypothetical protein